MDKTIYVVNVNGNDVGDYDRLTDAIRDWDASTFMMERAFGHIRVMSWAKGLMVRDGYILKVDEESGRVYLNPGLTDSPEVAR